MSARRASWAHRGGTWNRTPGRVSGVGSGFGGDDLQQGSRVGMRQPVAARPGRQPAPVGRPRAAARAAGPRPGSARDWRSAPRLRGRACMRAHCILLLTNPEASILRNSVQSNNLSVHTSSLVSMLLPTKRLACPLP